MRNLYCLYITCGVLSFLLSAKRRKTLCNKLNCSRLVTEALTALHCYDFQPKLIILIVQPIVILQMCELPERQ